MPGYKILLSKKGYSMEPQLFLVIAPNRVRALGAACKCQKENSYKGETFDTQVHSVELIDHKKNVVVVQDWRSVW